MAARTAGAPFALFTGTASLMREALREDSAGAVLAVANLHPGRASRSRARYDERRDEDAERLQAELAAHDAQIRTAGGIAALKRAVAERVGNGARGARAAGRHARERSRGRAIGGRPLGRWPISTSSGTRPSRR